MVSNIVVVCMLNEFKKKIGLKLADSLDMFYADINDLVEFDVINSEDVEKKMGKEYLNKLINKQVENVANFENSIITADVQTLTSNRNVDVLKKSSIVVYLQVSVKDYMKSLNKSKDKEVKPLDIINSSLFFDRDKLCGKSADIIIPCKSLAPIFVTRQIIKQLERFYKKEDKNE